MATVRDTDQGRLLTRRAFLLGGVQAGFFAMLTARLYDLQIVQGERYRTLAEENRISTRIVLPDRGVILDRNGAILARSEVSLRAELVLDGLKDPRESLRRLYQLIVFDEHERVRIEKDLKRRRSLQSLLLRDNLSWEHLAVLEINTPDLPGISIESGQKRYYPFGAPTAHLLGYTGAANETEAGRDPLLNHPGFRMGKNGIEKIYDVYLRGIAGSEQLEVNVHNRPVRQLAVRDGIRGRDVQLTLDMRLQNYMQERLQTEQSASAVLMDCMTGGLYAMAAHPSYDPNLFAGGISRTDFKKLNDDPYHPLLNKATMGQYAPGSTFKVAVILAALEMGIKPDTRFSCAGHLDYGNHRFHCWKKGGHGSVDMFRAITQSCDVYLYRLSQKIGVDVIAKYAKMLGLGEKTGIDLPHEKAGLVPNREWKKKRFKQNWGGGETLITAIGQGYMLATPLQLAVMTSRLVNGGRAVQPHIMNNIQGAVRAQEDFPFLPLDASHLEFVKRTMAGVCQPGGTAARSQIAARGYEMGGKTGTSQVRRISKSERNKGVVPNEQRPWEERDHALFIGFAPVDNPRYVASVIVEHGGGGSKAAAPIARDLLIHAMRLDPAGVLAAPLTLLPPDEQQDEKAEDIFIPLADEESDIPPEHEIELEGVEDE